jgi:hypothetical protein
LDVIVGEYVRFYVRENVSKTGVDGAWRFCTNDLVTAYAVKVAFFSLDAVLFRQAPQSSHGFRRHHLIMALIT